MLHDDAVYKNPDEFIPERFLETTNPRLQDFELPFGFGRRICVGMHLARNSLFITISRILWAFDIIPPLADNGKPVLPDRWDFTNGFNSKPVSFRCQIKARSARAAECVEREWEGAKERLGKWQ